MRPLQIRNWWNQTKPPPPKKKTAERTRHESKDGKGDGSFRERGKRCELWKLCVCVKTRHGRGCALLRINATDK